MDNLETLEMQPWETFAELVTRAKVLVGRLPSHPCNFMVRKWIEKALPRSSQQKLRETLMLDATLEESIDVFAR